MPSTSKRSSVVFLYRQPVIVSLYVCNIMSLRCAISCTVYRCLIPIPKYLVGEKTTVLGNDLQIPKAGSTKLITGDIMYSHCFLVRLRDGNGYDRVLQIVDVSAIHASFF